MTNTPSSLRHYQPPSAEYTVVLIGFDYPVGTYTVGSRIITIPALVGGWFLCRERVAAIAEQRRVFTGDFPVIAARPLADSRRPTLGTG